MFKLLHNVVCCFASLAVVACGPSTGGEGGTDADTGGVEDGGGSGSGSQSEGGLDSDGSGSGDTGVGPGNCEELRDRESCESTEFGPGSRCFWADVERYSEKSCEGDVESEGICVRVQYQGEGCLVEQECGTSDGPGSRYYRAGAGGTAEVIRDGLIQFCEYQPVGFELCQFDSQGELLSGPLVCACGCGLPPTALPDDVESALTRRGGCGDIELYASNDQDSLGMTLSVPGSLVRSHETSGETIEVSMDAADLGVRVMTGTDVTSLQCADVIVEKPAIIDEWFAEAGGATVKVETIDDRSVATVTLTDIELVRFGGTEAAFVPGYTWDEVVVGWFPG